MSTRKSLKHHVLLRHVLRNRESFKLLIGNKIVKKNESNLIDFLYESPELLWKKIPTNNLNIKIQLTDYTSKDSYCFLKNLSNFDDQFVEHNNELFVIFNFFKK